MTTSYNRPRFIVVDGEVVTERQADVWELLAAGYTNKAIAEH